MFREESNRVASCFGYIVFCAYPDSQNFSSLLLCHCKLIKYRTSLFKDRENSSNNNNNNNNGDAENNSNNNNNNNNNDNENELDLTPITTEAGCSRENHRCQAKSLLVVVNRLQSVYLLLASTESLHKTHTTIASGGVSSHCIPFNYKCPICCVRFDVDEDIVVLSCQHGFHKECLNRTLLEAAACPCCKSVRNMESLRTGQKVPQVWRNLCDRNAGEFV